MAADRYGLDGTSSGHNTCVRIIHGNSCSDHYHPSPILMDGTEMEHGFDNDAVQPRKEPAAVLDGSGYAARLVVLPTFGCVLHEPKGNADKETR